MVERHPGRDPGLQQAVDQAIVEIEPGVVDLTPAVRQNPRPGDGEAVGGEAQLPHQRDVFPPAVVVIAGDIPAVGVEDLPGCVAEPIPDRLPPPILPRRPLDLVGRGRRPPDKPIRETPARVGGGRARHDPSAPFIPASVMSHP